MQDLIYWDWANQADDSPCPYCDAEEVEVIEIAEATLNPTPNRHVEFNVAFCCEQMQEEFSCLVDEHGFAKLTHYTKVERLLGAWLGARRIYNDPLDWDEPWQVDYGLSIETLGGFSNDELWNSRIFRLKNAQDFIRRHHRHNGPPVGWRWAHAILNGSEVIGIVWVGRPVARHIDQATVVEVNRLCLNHGLDPHLTWKAASLGYNTAADTARARGFQKIITYTNADVESGRSLQYARWKKDGAPSKGGSWDRPSRQRTITASTGPKQRWMKALS